jgi:hypothetical protein
MKRFLLVLLVISFLGCESEYNALDVVTDVQAAIVRVTENGTIVEVRITDNGLFEIVGVPGYDIVAPAEIMPVDFDFNPLIPVSELKFALDTCPAFPGLPSPQFDWFCAQTGDFGRFIGYDVPNPTVEDIHIYEECPSDTYQCPMTYKIYYSAAIYGAHHGTETNLADHRQWMVENGFGDARIDFCEDTEGSLHCNQDEGTDGGI